MHVNGYSKTKVAEILGVSRTTVRRWLRTGTYPYLKPYPSEVRERAIEKIEVASMLNLPYYLINQWIADILSANSKLSGAAEKILAEVIKKGYFFPKPAQLNICRNLKQNLGLRLIKLNGRWILYASSEKDKAMKAMLEKSKMNYLSAQKLAIIRRSFYEGQRNKL